MVYEKRKEKKKKKIGFDYVLLLAVVHGSLGNFHLGNSRASFLKSKSRKCKFEVADRLKTCNLLVD